MNWQPFIRFAAVLAGAVVVLALGQGFGASYYIAIPLGVVAYIATRVGLGVLFERSSGAK